MRSLPPGLSAAILAASLAATEVPPTMSHRKTGVGRSRPEEPFRKRPRTEAKEKARRRRQIERGIILATPAGRP